MNSTTEKYFSGKNIIITGAFNGIGRSLSQALLPVCQKLYCLDNSKDSQQKFMQSFGSLKKSPSVYLLDLTDKCELDRVLKEICDTVKIDILFANAGIKGTNSFLSYDQELAHKVFEINFLGFCNTVIPVLNQMLKNKHGHIVGTSSLGVYRGMVKGAPYFSSKSAVAVFMESLRLEVKSQGIAVTTLFPGYVKTAMTEQNTVPPFFMMSPDVAAQKILYGVGRKKSTVAFPWQMRIVTFFNRLLPNFLYDYFARKMAGISG
ncbi:MAG: SDR family NAD(P)-dependent oxidoreductase [Bdellovibrionota bacterium]